MRAHLFFLLLALATIAKAQTVTISANRMAICTGIPNNFTATTSGSGPSTSYQWQVNGTNVGLNSAAFTSATLAVGDKVGCTISNTGNVAVPTAVSNVITMVAGDNAVPSCLVGQITTNRCQITFQAVAINGGSAPVYQWKLNGVNVGANADIYVDTNPVNGDLVSCVVTNTTTCAPVNSGTGNRTLSLAVNPLNISIASDPALCQGDYATHLVATVSKPEVIDHYEWYYNGSLFLVTTAPQADVTAVKQGDAAYIVAIPTDTCQYPPRITSPTYALKFYERPTTTITATDGQCAGSAITFTATPSPADGPAYQWLLNGTAVAGATNKTFTRSDLKNGDQVSCTVVNKTGCAVPTPSAPYTVTVYSPPAVSLPKNVPLVLGQSVQLTPTIAGDAAVYKWTPANGLDNPNAAAPFANPRYTTTYQLVVTSSRGCVAQPVSVTVNVSSDLKIANTFTPNGDGVNDTWDIHGLSDCLECTVDVFNRYGKVVFHSLGYTRPWDGKTNGKPVPAGTYYYVIDTKKLLLGNIGGPVTILR